MRCRDAETYARVVDGGGGRADDDDRELAVERQPRKVANLVRLVEHHRHDGRRVVPQHLQPECLQTFAEKLGIIAELPELLGADVGSILAGDDAEGGEDLGAHRRGHGARVGATRGELANSSDSLVVSRHVPTRRAERFGKRSHHDVDILGIHAELLAHAPPGLSDGTDGVRLVEPHVRAVELANLDNLREAAQFALHRVDALDDDQNLVVPLLTGDGILEDELQVPDAVVLERLHLGAAQPRTLHDGVVVQRVGDDQVPLTRDGRDHRGVRREAHAHDHRRLLAHVLCRHVLHLLDERVVAQLRGGPGRGDGVIHHGFGHERRAVRVETAESEVVVRPEVEASPGLRGGDELAEVPALRLRLADPDVDPVLRG